MLTGQCCIGQAARCMARCMAMLRAGVCLPVPTSYTRIWPGGAAQTTATYSPAHKTQQRQAETKCVLTQWRCLGLSRPLVSSTVGARRAQPCTPMVPTLWLMASCSDAAVSSRGACDAAPVGRCSRAPSGRRRRRTRWVDRWMVGGAGVGDLATHLHTNTKAPPQLGPNPVAECGRGEPRTRNPLRAWPAAAPMHTRGLVRRRARLGEAGRLCGTLRSSAVHCHRY